MLKNNNEIEIAYIHLNKSWLPLAIKFFFLGLVCLLLSYIVNSDHLFLHGIFFVLSSLIIFNQFVKLINKPLEILLIDLRWLLIFFFWIYFVAGSSIILFGNKEIIDNLIENYYIDANLGLRVDAINSFGLSIALLVFTKLKVFWPTKILNTIISFGSFKKDQVLIFSIIFLLCSLLHIFLVKYNFSEKGELFEIINNFSFYGIGYLLLFFYYKEKYQLLINFFLIIYVTAYTFLGFVNLNKTLMIIFFFFTFFFYSVKKNSIKLLIIIPAITFFLLYTLGNYTSAKRSGLKEFFFYPSDSALSYSVWDRLNYINIQSFAVNSYDRNEPSDHLDNFFWVFTPRFLAKNKKNISQFTNDFADKLGFEGSAISPGVFIEGYYYFGWIGLIFTSCLVGLILKFYSILIKTIFFKKMYLFYFVIFSGMWSAIRIDGIILLDYLGSFINIFFIIIFFALILFGINKAKRLTK